jgi:UDP-3-O-[3-hydroxymyristoyl] glucosamine N-acyltransferase
VKPNPIRLGDLAAELGRDVEGDARVWIEGVAPLEVAGPGDLSFARSLQFEKRLSQSRAAAIIAPPDLDAGGRPTIRSPNPALDFARATRRILPGAEPVPGIHPSAFVAGDARVDASASIGPACTVGPGSTVGPHSVLIANVSLYSDVQVGADCVLHAGCVLCEGTIVGDRVILHPGVVLGGDGFGYVPNAEGGFEKAAQVGRVVLADDVEIGANSTVDRGSLGDTTIGRSVKIDNLVQIGHNCQIGEKVMIVGQAGLAGSTRVEREAIIMAQAGVAGHLTIGEKAFIGPQSGVHKDVPAGVRVLGSPQREERSFHRLMAALVRLPGLFPRIRAIERRLGLDAESTEGEGAPDDDTGRS